MRAESEENTALTNSCVHDAEGPGIEQPWQPLVDIIQIIAVSEMAEVPHAKPRWPLTAPLDTP